MVLSTGKSWGGRCAHSVNGLWFPLAVRESRVCCPENLRAAKERMILANLVEGTYHDIVVEFKEEGGYSSIQVSLFIE